MRRIMTVMLALALSFAAMAAERRWLITPEDVARVGREEGLDPLPMAAVEGPGPLIVVMNPKALERLRSPVNILIRFEAGGSGQAPDMNSLSVTLRGLFSIDITERLRAYLTGATLAVNGADLPTGSHRIRLVLADMAGNLSARDVTLVVVEGE